MQSTRADMKQSSKLYISPSICFKSPVANNILFKPAVFFGLRFHSFKGVYVTATIVHVFNNTFHYVT